jgi:hypothetical protein
MLSHEELRLTDLGTFNYNRNTYRYWFSQISYLSQRGMECKAFSSSQKLELFSFTFLKQQIS